jgi:hypothetical protein
VAKLVRTPHPGILLNEHCHADGAIVFAHARKLGCEGFVSKRSGCCTAPASDSMPSACCMVEQRALIIGDLLKAGL